MPTKPVAENATNATTTMLFPSNLGPSPRGLMVVRLDHDRRVVFVPLAPPPPSPSEPMALEAAATNNDRVAKVHIPSWKSLLECVVGHGNAARPRPTSTSATTISHPPSIVAYPAHVQVVLQEIQDMEQEVFASAELGMMYKPICNNQTAIVCIEWSPSLSCVTMSSHWLLDNPHNGETTTDCPDGNALLLQSAFARTRREIGHSSDLYDMFVSYLQEQQSATTTAWLPLPMIPKVVAGAFAMNDEEWDEEKGVGCSGMNKENAATTAEPVSINERCLICLEDLEENELEVTSASVTKYFRMQPCGHGVCIECWTAYLQSVAASGQPTTIVCPAHQCAEASIGLWDFPHILFGPQTTLPEQDALVLFSTLLSNTCTDFCLREKHGVHCPSPVCDRVLVPVPKKSAGDADGRRIMICQCGATVCADCPVGRNSGTHPGISCAAYCRLRDDIDAGKADEEYLSYRYVVANSRPCPRCGMSTEKVSGCNHMRCHKCQYYYCWECGGEGQLCDAYRCFNRDEDATASGSYERPNEKVKERDLSAPKVAIVRTCRAAHDRLQHLEKTIRHVSKLKATVAQMRRMQALVLERQMAQTALWLRLFLSQQDGDAILASMPLLKRLEVLDIAIEIRTEVSSTGATATLEQIAEAMGVAQIPTDEATPSSMTERPETEKFKLNVATLFQTAREAADVREDNMRALFVDPEFVSLCTMKTGDFRNQVLAAIEQVVVLLFP